MQFEDLGRTIPRPPAKRRYGLPVVLALLMLLLLSARTIASYIIEYNWWSEMKQVPTWVDLILYGTFPIVAASLIAFAVLWVAHARALKFAGTRLGRHRTYARISTVVLLLIGALVALFNIDSWTVIRYAGGLSLPPEATSWHDPVFDKPLSFYLFNLPFYTMLRQFLVTTLFAAGLVYWLSARGWQLRDQLPMLERQTEIDPRIFRLEGGLESRFLRGLGVLILLAIAVQFYLGRYEMLLNDHGFMVGADYVDEGIRLPLQWLAIAAAVVAAGLISRGIWIPAGVVLVAVLVIRGGVPLAVSSIYVRPNEISIQRPYIERHIGATRNAFGLADRVREMEFPTAPTRRIHPANHEPLLSNVRLWDWRAFFDTITQIQALRPYYVFPDADVDRYILDGRLRQVLLTPRELDIRQLPDAQTRWINPHFIYTHGYGLVMAEANQITPDGLPILFIKDAPAQVLSEDVKLTRPEIYYGEQVHEPVFVRTGQPEFSYPSGNDNVFTRYEGPGGFPISSFLMRVVAAVAQGDVNILLTTYLTPESRMMIRRNVRERLIHLAGFVTWDADPYLVVTDEGRLVWTVDGYTTSSAHPYSQRIMLGGRAVNYIRNSVKATVDAYSGEAHLYVFEPGDPIIQAYQRLFPQLLEPASAMPTDLRFHARYPETMFRAQAEIYRTYHMLDPQAFYNKEDLWDIARNVYGQGDRPQPVTPTFVVATLPGETEPEFLLIIPFTPRNKDNMIGLMVARCDGEHLGELVFLQLSKQELIFGPMQIEARINQDEVISKDLNLWNQQGSQVLRGQMLVLPVEDTFLYIEPIYIQASEARMPQLKKVAMAMGNDLIYADTYQQALTELARLSDEPGTRASRRGREDAPVERVATAREPARDDSSVAAAGGPRLDQIRTLLRRYRELSAQGKFSEAGRALESLEAELNRP